MKTIFRTAVVFLFMFILLNPTPTKSQSYPYLQHFGTIHLQPEDQPNEMYYLHCGGDTYLIDFILTFYDGAQQLLPHQDWCATVIFVPGHLEIQSMIQDEGIDPPGFYLFFPTIQK